MRVNVDELFGDVIGFVGEEPNGVGVEGSMSVLRLRDDDEAPRRG